MPQNMYHDFKHRNLIEASANFDKKFMRSDKKILAQNKYTIKIVVRLFIKYHSLEKKKKKPL